MAGGWFDAVHMGVGILLGERCISCKDLVMLEASEWVQRIKCISNSTQYIQTLLDLVGTFDLLLYVSYGAPLSKLPMDINAQFRN